MKVVYIAGKYRGESPWQVAENIREAERWALEVAKAGATPLCPHTMYRYFDGLLTDEFWIAATLELLRRCDAGFFCPKWLESVGSRSEHSWCEQHGVQVFGPAHLVDGQFAQWLAGEHDTKRRK